MTVLCLLTCYAVVLPSILNNSVLLPQSGGLHSILQDSRSAGVIVAHGGLPKLHVVDVHVSGAHSELADVGVQGKLLIPGSIFE